MPVDLHDAVNAWVIAVSIKIRSIVCLKRELLFLSSVGARQILEVGVVRPCGDRWKIEMQSTSADVQGRILALVKTILEQNAMTAEIGLETRLVDVGLTSMDMVNLMLGVEAEFDFTIPQSEITPENFLSVKTLERMIVNQLQLAAA